MSKNALILGGGIQQIPLIKKLKERDYKILLIDYYNQPPGKKYADKHLKVSTLDMELILNVIHERDIDIDLVATMATDQPVLSASYIAEKLGIYYPLSYSDAIKVTNKSHMKRILKSNDIDTPNYHVLSEFPHSSIFLQFPIIVKPTDNQGQRGISAVNNEKELKNAINYAINNSCEKKCIVEDFVPGKEVSINAFVIKNKLSILMITDRKHFSYKKTVGVCKAHEYPSSINMTERDNLIKITKKIINAFSLSNTPLYMQAIVQKDSNISVIEFGCRIGGGLEAYLLPLTIGIDVVDVYIDQLERKGVSINKSNYYAFSAVDFIMCRPGKISRIIVPNFLYRNNKLFHFFNFYNNGETIRQFKNATSRVAAFITASNNLEEYKRNRKTIRESIKIINKNGNNLVITN